MKLRMTFYILLSTSLLILVAVMAFYKLPFSWIFWMTLVGQASLLVMVYKILTDDYTTEKTFEDWYEDRPLKD